MALTSDRVTIEQARTLALDPVPTLMARHGDAIANTRRRVDDLDQALRELDSVTEMLAEKKITVGADLGAVGNAARFARTAQLADASVAAFELPRKTA